MQRIIASTSMKPKNMQNICFYQSIWNNFPHENIITVIDHLLWKICFTTWTNVSVPTNFKISKFHQCRKSNVCSRKNKNLGTLQHIRPCTAKNRATELSKQKFKLIKRYSDQKTIQFDQLVAMPDQNHPYRKSLSLPFVMFTCTGPNIHSGGNADQRTLLFDC